MPFIFAMMLPLIKDDADMLLPYGAAATLRPPLSLHAACWRYDADADVVDMLRRHACAPAPCRRYFATPMLRYVAAAYLCLLSMMAL